MITRPSKFKAYQNSTGIERHLIVKIVKGSNTWLFSDCDMQLTDGHVYPLLIGRIQISESVDIFSKQWRVGDLNLKLSNVPYKTNSSGTWLRLSDEWSNVIDADITVYLSVGRTFTALSDCLVRYVGKIVKPPEYTDKMLTLKAIDEGRTKNIYLPKRAVIDEYPDAPNFAGIEKIPIIYGEYSTSSDGNYKSGLGLAPARLIETTGTTSKYIISDHQLYSASEAWLDNRDILLEMRHKISPTLNTNDSGRGTVTIAIGPTSYAYSYIYPDICTGDLNYIDNPENVYDRDNDTYSTIKKSTTPATSFWYENVKLFGPQSLDYLGKAGGIVEAKTQMKAAMESGVTLDNATDRTYIKIINLNEGTAAEEIIAFDHNDINGKTTWTDFTWTCNSSTDPKWTNKSGGIHWELWGKYFGGSGQAGGLILIYIWQAGGAPNENDPIMKVYDLRCRIKSNIICCGKGVFVECKGMKFGSWIDAGGRSNSYNEGNLIEDPAFIIESLLRDEAGISSSDIDTGSFDDAANSSVKARINLHSKNELTLEQSIRQLCEQSTFAYVYTAAGKAKLIPLNDTSPTTAVRDTHPVKIPFSHIKKDSIKIGKTSKIINHLTAKSRYQQEYGVYRDKNVTQNSSSQTDYGTWKYNASWPNICGASATHIANHLIVGGGGPGEVYGIWAKSQSMVELITVGFTGADIEIGDWIEIDSTMIDPQIKLFGSSWSGKQFLVTGLTQMGIDGTKIKAMSIERS